MKACRECGCDFGIEVWNYDRSKVKFLCGMCLNTIFTDVKPPAKAHSSGEVAA